MSRILVFYGTSEGHTAKVALAIGERLLAAGVAADVIQAGTGDPRPSDYDGIVVAGSIHAGGYQWPLVKWLKAHCTELADRPSAFVSVCLGVRSQLAKERDEARAIPRRLAERLGWHPTAITVVAGALPYTRYNILTRWLMKRIVAAAGGDTDTSRDYEYTDWRALRDFTDRFAAVVEPEMSAPVTCELGAPA